MKPLFHLNKYLLKYKNHLLLGIVFVTISVIFRVFQARFVGDSFDTIETLLSNASTELELSNLKTALLKYGLMIIGAAILQGAFMFLMRQSIIVMSRHIEYDLKNEVFDQYQKLSLAFYKRNNTGDLMNRISEDVGRVRMYIGPAIMYTINVAILTTIIIGMMVNESLELTLLVLIPLPVLAYAVYRVSDLINKRSTVVQEQLSVLSTFTQETFSGIRVGFSSGTTQANTTSAKVKYRAMGAQYTMGAAVLTATSQKLVGGDTYSNVGVAYTVAPGMSVVLESGSQEDESGTYAHLNVTF